MKNKKYTKISSTVKVLELKTQQRNTNEYTLTALEEINNLVTYLDTLQHLPEWPYNTSVLKRFIGAWVSSIVALLITVFAELIIAWLT